MAKHGLSKIFAKMLEIFVFEWLIEISRKRFIENLETLLLFFFICRQINVINSTNLEPDFSFLFVKESNRLFSVSLFESYF